MSTFPKLGVSDIGKSTELATALCDLELDLLMLIATACALLASVLSVASLQDFLVVFLGKAHIPQELGVHTLTTFISLWLGFLHAILGTKVWCVSWIWPGLHQSLQLSKLLGLEELISSHLYY